MEEYLTVKELSAKIKFSKQSLYNLIHRGSFILGKHYLKPTPKKVLFKWSEIRGWMGDELYPEKVTPSESEDSNSISENRNNPATTKSFNLIKI